MLDLSLKDDPVSISILNGGGSSSGLGSVFGGSSQQVNQQMGARGEELFHEGERLQDIFA